MDGVPRSHQEAADEVRRHLVMLRGGAPFLSSADALLLVRWLDDGVSVASVLCALERASEARRANRSRVPLRLGHARRHLGKVARPGWRAAPATELRHPLAPLIARIEVAALTDPARAVLRDLAGVLRGLAGPRDDVLRDAMTAIRAFFDGAWASLPAGERAALTQDAERELDDLIDLVDAATAASIVEETARDLFRQRYPWLSAGTVHAVLEGA